MKTDSARLICLTELHPAEAAGVKAILATEDADTDRCPCGAFSKAKALRVGHDWDGCMEYTRRGRDAEIITVDEFLQKFTD